MACTVWGDLKMIDTKNIEGSLFAAINDEEIICIPPGATADKIDTDNERGIFKYNVGQNEWDEFIKYPENFPCASMTPHVDKQGQKIFLYVEDDNEENKIIVIDINTHQFIIKSDPDSNKQHHGVGGFLVCYTSKMVNCILLEVGNIIIILYLI